MIDVTKLKSITSPELYNSKTKKAHPKGLFSEQIFGPEMSFRCQCGKYSIRELHRDLRCPSCGVLCESNESRYTTFAKIFSIAGPEVLEIIKKTLNVEEEEVNNLDMEVGIKIAMVIFEQNKTTIMNSLKNVISTPMEK